MTLPAITNSPLHVDTCDRVTRLSLWSWTQDNDLQIELLACLPSFSSFQSTQESLCACIYKLWHSRFLLECQFGEFWPNKVTTTLWCPLMANKHDEHCSGAVTFSHLFYFSRLLVARPGLEWGPWWRRRLQLMPRRKPSSRGGAPPSRHLARASMPALRCLKTPRITRKSVPPTLQISRPSRRKKKSKMSGACLLRQKVGLWC